MSHFIVNIILPKDEVRKGKIEEMLAPYDENIQVKPYILHYRRNAKKLHNEELKYYKGILDSKDKNFNLANIENHYTQLQKMTAFEYYAHHFKGRKKDKAGNILSTYSPKSKWDWWQIGGRYAGWLLNQTPEKANHKIENNCCPIKLAIEEKKIPFALILPNGKWIERGKMGWWAFVTDETPEKEWEKIVLDYYKKYPAHMVAQIDCHI
jgi:hypothetical protein